MDINRNYVPTMNSTNKKIMVHINNYNMYQLKCTNRFNAEIDGKLHWMDNGDGDAMNSPIFNRKWTIQRRKNDPNGINLWRYQ